MSLRARIIKRLLFFQFSGWSEGSIEEQRARQKKNNRFTRLPADILCQPVSANGVPAEWIEAPGADLGLLLYLHGGAYTLGSTDTHREWIARLARACKLRALSINYRLAPEHPYPAALEDATTAYLWLLDQGFDPSQIIISGDSSGGGLTLTSLLTLRDAEKPLPAAAVCISPWMDLALTGASIQNKVQVDPILDPLSLKKYAAYYAGENELTSPLISPLYADLKGLPPLLIQVGADEILLDDARRYAEKAQEAGENVTLEIWDGMVHVFQLIPFLPETKKAVEHISEFVSQNLKSRKQK